MVHTARVKARKCVPFSASWKRRHQEPAAFSLARGLVLGVCVFFILCGFSISQIQYKKLLICN